MMRKGGSLFLVLGLLTITCPAFAQSYTFSTIAGLAGESGWKDGLNAEARFHNPCGLALDAAGNLFVSDLQTNVIRKLTPSSGSDWQVSTIAGNPGTAGSADGTNDAASFNRPRGIAVDASGNVYVADRVNHLIRKLTPDNTDWVVTTIAGIPGTQGEADGPGALATFRSPSGVAVGPDGLVVVADLVNSTIRTITFREQDSDWHVATVAGFPLDYGFVDGFGEDAVFDFPSSPGFDTQTNLYVADWGNHAIRKITGVGLDWQVTTIAGLSGLPGSADGSGVDAQFRYPNALAVDATGVIYVTDQDNHAIRALTPGSDGSYTVSTIGGAPGSPPGHADGAGAEARFNKPWGIAVDARGVLFIADFGNHTIRMGVPGLDIPTISYLAHPDEMVLSWPAEAADYLLETAPSLAPGAPWTPITTGILLSGRSFVYTARYDFQQPAAFFRLRKE